MRNYKLMVFTIVTSAVIRVVSSSTLRPYYFKLVIDSLSSPVINQHELFKNVYMVMLVILISMVVGRSSRFLYFIFVSNMTRDLRDFSFQKIEQNSYTFFSNTFAGSLVTKSRRLINSFEKMLDSVLYNFLTFFVALVGVLGVLFYESTKLGLIFLSFVAVNVLILLLLVRRKMKYDLLSAEQDSKISGRLADTFGNILAVKFFSARNREIKSFGEYTEESARRDKKAWFFGGRIEIIQTFFTFLFQGLLLYFMVVFWLKGEVSTGTVVLVQMYMVIIGDLLWEFSSALTTFMRSVSDMQELIEIFEIVPDILDPKKPEKLAMNKGHIVFKNVTFKYQIGEPILSDFNLDIKVGERVGVVGHSGAGKSTLTKLLLRANDVTEGSITIDGQDVRNVTQDDLHSAISYIPQEPVLFHRPIKENINYGNPEASMEEIIEVSKKAHAHDFIDKLEQKYETLVGERGVKLSGGERQRVAIARAMLKDAPILVLDEATSSLDSISESYIQEAFTELMKGKTTIVIAHRLSTIQKMDRIIVLDAGKIVQEGTHQELLQKGGLYKELWDHQTGGFLEE
jgi:ATP-binding cassette subfamily B protein